MSNTATEERTLLIDSREQKPYDLPGEEIALKTGDYSLSGDLRDKVTIERKTAQDLRQCATFERSRFEAELERLSEFELPIVLVETSFKDFITPPPESQIHPNSLFGSICAWISRYRVNFLFVGGRELGKRSVKKLLQKYAKYQTKR